MSNKEEKIQLTQGDWDELVGMVKKLVDVICGDEQMNEKGLKREHDEMYEWFNHSKWLIKLSKTLIGIFGIEFFVALAYGITKLVEWFNSVRL